MHTYNTAIAAAHTRKHTQHTHKICTRCAQTQGLANLCTLACMHTTLPTYMHTYAPHHTITNSHTRTHNAQTFRRTCPDLRTPFACTHASTAPSPAYAPGGWCALQTTSAAAPAAAVAPRRAHRPHGCGGCPHTAPAAARCLCARPGLQLARAGYCGAAGGRSARGREGLRGSKVCQGQGGVSGAGRCGQGGVLWAGRCARVMEACWMKAECGDPEVCGVRRRGVQRTCGQGVFEV